jgi:hypothetical protein
MTRWPYPPEPRPGPWETKQYGPLIVRVRRKDRYAVERRNLRRRWDVFKEHFGRESGLYRLVDWLSRRLA